MTNELRNIRIAKLEAWEQHGYGYAERFDRTHTALEAHNYIVNNTDIDNDMVHKTPSSMYKMCGRIMNKRDMGGLSFLQIRDYSGDMQVIMSKNVLLDKYDIWLPLLDLGDFIGVTGDFMTTKKGEPSLIITDIQPLSKALLPLPEKYYGVEDTEMCYRKRYLDILTNEDTYKRFKIRTQVIRSIRSFLDNLGFEEVETRVLQPQAGGAMARVFSTYHNALDTDMVMRIATELDLKMCLASRYERVYEIGKDFRNEGIDPSHLQEFTMLEWYCAYKDIHTNMDWTEEMLKKILLESIHTLEIEVYNKDDELVKVSFNDTFERIQFNDLLIKYADIDMFTATDEEIKQCAMKWGMSPKDAQITGRGNLLDHIYKKSARVHIIKPTYIINYPTDLKPLARPNGDGTSSCFQLIIAGWEIVNAYGELINPLEQRSLLEVQAAFKAGGDDEAMDIDEEFITAMEHGFPPMTGNGIGIDRLVSLITQSKNLKDTVLFPMMKRV